MYDQQLQHLLEKNKTLIQQQQAIVDRNKELYNRQVSPEQQ